MTPSRDLRGVVQVVVDPRFAEAYEKHASDLVSYATALVGSGQAEDLVAEAALRTLRTVDWDRVADSRAYLFRCVLNEARRLHRRRPVPVHELLRAFHRSDTSVRSGVDELGVFRHLSIQERAVVYLAYWEDAPVQEIARTLGIGDGTVRRYLARARAKLRKELAGERT